MSERRMRIVVTSLLVILANGLSVRSGDLPFPDGGTEVPGQLVRPTRNRFSRSDLGRARVSGRAPHAEPSPRSRGDARKGRRPIRSANRYAPVRHYNAGTPAPFPTDDPPPVERSPQPRTAFFTTSPAAVSRPGSETPNWISRTGPLISQTHSASPTVQPVETRGGAQSTTRTRPSTADGTWREDGGFVIINLGGRELRLRKEGTPVRTTSYSVPSRRTAKTLSTNDAPASSRETDSRANDLSRFVGSRGGTVVGRLLNGRKPLANCRVALIPIEKAGFGGYDIDAKSKPQSATTDETGNYRIENVPAGLYKLFWLPAGTRRWIRRIQFEPDATVRSGESVEVKTIRLAVRTVN